MASQLFRRQSIRSSAVLIIIVLHILFLRVRARSRVLSVRRTDYCAELILRRETHEFTHVCVVLQSRRRKTSASILETMMAKRLRDIKEIKIERPQRAKLSAEESLRRTEEFDKRREKFIASIRKGKG